MTNPANAKNQILGVYDKKWLNTHCEVLKELGSKNVLVVHGLDGLDEISLSANTHICELKDNKIQNYIFDPREIGYDYISLDEIKGGDPKYNALELRSLLEGKEGPYKDIVLLNSAAAILGSGHEKDFGQALNKSKKSLESGKALKKLDGLISITNNQ